jgi:ribosomal protein L29
MKKAELKELRQMDIPKLEKKLSDLTKKKVEAEIKISAGQEKNVRSAKSLRRDISQTMTILNEKRKESHKK